MESIVATGLLFCLFVVKGRAAEVCYDDLGCFSDGGCHTYGFPPRTPDFINTRFYLYTRRNKDTPQELSRNDIAGLRASNFDPQKRTKFSIHGWNANGFTGGELGRKDAFLEVEDANVIIVDWRRGAAGVFYPKNHQNTRVAGREIALFARFLNLEKGMYYKDVHLIGLSLGGHVAGYAGEYQPGLGRITGLDPAGPFYRNDGPECRLDPSDAKFVDVIHGDGTKVIGLGSSIPMGHQDFYPNGGRYQPACRRPDVLTGCSHTIASAYFTESIRSTTCQFTAFPCLNFVAYIRGWCNTCGVQGCAVMGYPAEEHTDLSGTFYLDTNDQAPYCVI